MERKFFDDGNIQIERKYGCLIINGTYYRSTSKDGKETLKEIPIKEIKQKEKTVEKLADKLKESVDGKKILTEILMGFHPKEITKLEKIVFSKKRKYKAKTRSHHCVDLKVGNFIVPMIND